MSHTKTKAELLEMLAEAVRNTQPQPVGNTQPEPPRAAQAPRTRKMQSRKRAQRRSARPKSKTFGHLLAASSGVDSATEDSMIDKMTKDPAQRLASKRTTNDCGLSD